jgi:hypothetical protein
MWHTLRSSFLSKNPAQSVPLGCGLEVWLGYSASARLAQPTTPASPRISLVVDRAASSFVKAQSVIDLIKDTTRMMEPSLRQGPIYVNKISEEIRIGGLFRPLFMF